MDAPTREPSPEAVRAWKECPVCNGCGCDYDGHGFESFHDENGPCTPCLTCSKFYAALDAAVAQEREACADLADTCEWQELHDDAYPMNRSRHNLSLASLAGAIAKAIRSRQP